MRNSVAVVLAALVFSCCIAESPYTRPCSGQGIVYEDSDYSRCECFDCFYGTSCESLYSDCPVNVAGGKLAISFHGIKQN